MHSARQGLKFAFTFTRYCCEDVGVIGFFWLFITPYFFVLSTSVPVSFRGTLLTRIEGGGGTKEKEAAFLCKSSPACTEYVHSTTCSLSTAADG